MVNIFSYTFYIVFFTHLTFSNIIIFNTWPTFFHTHLTIFPYIFYCFWKYGQHLIKKLFNIFFKCLDSHFFKYIIIFSYTLYIIWIHILYTWDTFSLFWLFLNTWSTFFLKWEVKKLKNLIMHSRWRKMRSTPTRMLCIPLRRTKSIFGSSRSKVTWKVDGEISF